MKTGSFEKQRLAVVLVPIINGLHSTRGAHVSRNEMEFVSAIQRNSTIDYKNSVGRTKRNALKEHWGAPAPSLTRDKKRKTPSIPRKSK